MKKSFVTAATISLALFMAGPAAAQEKKTVRFFTFVGANQEVVSKEIAKTYMESHPDVDVQVVESNSVLIYPQLLATKQTSPTNPAVHCGWYNIQTVARGRGDDMWDKIDASRVPNMANFLADDMSKVGDAAPWVANGIGLVYNKDKVKTPPESWTALWAPEFKGRVVLFDYDNNILTLTARLNGGGEDNIKPAFDIWSTHAGNIKALVTALDGMRNLMSSGEAWIAPLNSSVVHAWIKKDNMPVGFVIPKEGAIRIPLYLTMTKGSTPEIKAVCEDLINDHLNVANTKKYAELTGNLPLFKNAPAVPSVGGDPTLDPKIITDSMTFDYGKIAKSITEWKKIYDREVKTRL